MIQKILPVGGFFLDSKVYLWYNIFEIESSNDLPWHHSTLFLFILDYFSEVM